MTPTISTFAALRLLKRAGVARTRDLEREGVSRTQIGRLVRRGDILRVGRGLYRHAGATLSKHQQLAEAARRVPGGVVCLLSALRFHGLTKEDPEVVWMAIDRKAWRPRSGNPPLRVIYASWPLLKEGVEEHDIGGVPVRIFCAARTVADCFKFRHKIGAYVAIEAFRNYKRTHRNNVEPVWAFAELVRVARVIHPYHRVIHYE